MISTALNECIVSLENVLKLDYGTDRTVADVLTTAKQNIENTYGVEIGDKTIYEVQAENQLSAQNIELFLRDLTLALQQLALFTSVAIYDKQVPISLADVNYVGYASDQLITSLAYMMDKDLYATHHKEIVAPLTLSLDSVPLNSVKRLFTIVFMLDKLGVYDGASVVVQLLYLGGHTA